MADRAGRIVKLIMKGRFRKLLGRTQYEEFLAYVRRQAAIPSQTAAAIRLQIEFEEGNGCIWLVFGFPEGEEPTYIRLETLIVPDDPLASFDPPETLAGTNFFHAVAP